MFAGDVNTRSTKEPSPSNGADKDQPLVSGGTPREGAAVPAGRLGTPVSECPGAVRAGASSFAMRSWPPQLSVVGWGTASANRTD